MLNTPAFVDLRNYIKRRVAYARYRVGSTYYKCDFQDVSILSDGTVRVSLVINNNNQAITINRVELWSTNDELWAYETVSVSIQAVQTGVLYWFDFTVTEG